MAQFAKFFGQRRKALGYILAAVAELVVQAVPQTNPQNALVLHAVVAILGLFVVHGVPNDPPSLDEELEALLHGDATLPSPVAAAAPAYTLPSVPAVVSAVEDLSGKHGTA